MSLREISALARQGWLIGARGLRLSPAPRPIEPGASHVVAFVHGFFAAGPVFDPLRLQIEALGVPTLDFTYSPVGRFEAIAASLAEHLESRADGLRLALVGHSLGGLLCRWVVQEHGIAAERLVSIATPHRGTEVASRWPTSLARALRPGSPVLRRLREPTIPHLAIVAGRDTMVRPVASAAPSGAEIRWLNDVGHNAVLFDDEAHQLVRDELRSWRGGSSASPALQRNPAAE